jgi:hypothetical protein
MTQENYWRVPYAKAMTGSKSVRVEEVKRTVEVNPYHSRVWNSRLFGNFYPQREIRPQKTMTKRVKRARVQISELKVH